MYIKLSFAQCVVIVPQCWGGLVIGLEAKPEIVDTLPLGIAANLPVDEISTSLHHEEDKKYNYYFDCGTSSKEQVKNALKSFEQHYKGQLASTIAGENLENSILENLKIALNMHNPEEKNASKLKFINDGTSSPRYENSDDSDNEELDEKNPPSPKSYAEARLAQSPESLTRSTTPTITKEHEKKSEIQTPHSAPSTPTGLNHSSRFFTEAKKDQECKSPPLQGMDKLIMRLIC